MGPMGPMDPWAIPWFGPGGITGKTDPLFIPMGPMDLMGPMGSMVPMGPMGPGKNEI